MNHTQEDQNENTQRCPRCGGDMVVRTAGKGPNAGNQFYGCKNYPQCKGTRDLESTDPAVQAEPPDFQRGHNRSQHISPRDFPRRISLKQEELNRQQLFIESVALPREAISCLSQAPMDLSYQRALSQWKLSLPVVQTQSGFTIPPPWIHVAEKILKRGRLVPISEKLSDGPFTRVIGPSQFEPRQGTNTITLCMVRSNAQLAGQVEVVIMDIELEVCYEYPDGEWRRVRGWSPRT